MVDNSIGSQKNRLFFVSSRIADEHFSAIRNFIGEYPGGLIASDSVDTARALGRALQGRGEFEALVASDFQPGVDRDELYGVCDELYAELIRRYVRLVRDNPYIFQFEIEKFRSTFIDKFSSIISRKSFSLARHRKSRHSGSSISARLAGNMRFPSAVESRATGFLISMQRLPRFSDGSNPARCRKQGPT